MKKKVVACLTAVALAGTVAASAGALAGCGSADLRILLLADNNEDSFYKEYFKDLEEELGVKIKYNGYEESSYYDKVKIEIAQGKTPDIFYARPSDVIAYGRKLQSVEDYMTEQKAMDKPDVDFDDVMPNALDMYRYNESTKKIDANGKLYAFPKDLSTQQFGYNKTIVEKYTGWFRTENLPLPWELGKGNVTKVAYTWDEYHKICEHISSTLADGVQTYYYGCDVPSVEIIAKSYGASILDVDSGTVTLDNADFKAAVEYQAKLCTAQESGKKPAANREEASYANFTVGKVAFYSECGTWQIGAYNAAFNKNEGDDNWGVMPTPVKNEGDTWQGMIRSAGYVVSKDCKKPEIAKKIAASFMSKSTQNKLVSRGLTLPLLQSRISEYLKSENDAIYSPSSRSVFIDVINGTHGFTSVKYATGDTMWYDNLEAELDSMYQSSLASNGATNPQQYFATMNWTDIQTKIQNSYNEKNK